MSSNPPYYPNIFAQSSQNSFQQQQQQQQNLPPLQHSSFNPCKINQTGLNVQNQLYPPFKTEFHGNQQPVHNPNLMSNYYQSPQHLHSASLGAQNQNYSGSFSQNIMDQLRSCTNSATPIFILPNVCPTPSSAAPQIQPALVMGNNMGYPINYTQMSMPYTPTPFYCQNSCIPYPLPIPIYSQITQQNRRKEKPENCECCQKLNTLKENFKNSNTFNQTDEHKCKETEEDTICSKKNCPSALNLQALASQFLSIQGIIPCVATRLVLRKVPGSNITTNVEEIINRAQKAINQLNKDQLLTESRNAQQVNALINIHMTANLPPNIIPILTMIQLKVNLLKAQVENLFNNKLMENQGVRAEGAGNLDPRVLALKTDGELREFLAVLRQKECEEMVNLNFAPYYAQRVIAESRLTNIQIKISQVESEMEKRRSSSILKTSIVDRVQHQFSDPFSNQNSTFVAPHMYAVSSKHMFQSPDPFTIQVRNPKRLNLKPHVGSPETTYGRSEQKNSIEINRSINEYDNDNYENNNDSDGNKKLPIQKSSASLIVKVITDNGNTIESMNSSLNISKTDSQFHHIRSSDVNQESDLHEKSNFEEKSKEEKKIKFTTISSKGTRESSDLEEHSEFAANSTSKKNSEFNTDATKKEKES